MDVGTDAENDVADMEEIMPYKSKKQRSWMHINKPGLAKKWDKKYGGKIRKGK